MRLNDPLSPRAQSIVAVGLVAFLYLYLRFGWRPPSFPKPSNQRAMMLTLWRENAQARLTQLSRACSESPDQLERLIRQHPNRIAVIGPDTLLSMDMLRDLAPAVAGHDSTQSCARIIDSVSKVLDSPDRSRR
jgi:hypothetical protein